mgnify:CR=1 FL=1
MRYVVLLVDQLAGNLAEVWVFGSAASGDMWPDWMPMHSDIDLLFLTNQAVPQGVQEALVYETYPLFLESGHEISPQFRALRELSRPVDDRSREFATRVRTEGGRIYASEKREGNDGAKRC